MDDEALMLLEAIVDVHDSRLPSSSKRAAILVIKAGGGVTLFQHHSPGAHERISDAYDESLLNELHSAALVDVEYLSRSTQISSTTFGRRVVSDLRRARSPDALANVDLIVERVLQQSSQPNPLRWQFVRPLLDALQSYWVQSGLPATGIPTHAIVVNVPGDSRGVLLASIRQLIKGGYIEPSGELEIDGIPAEVSVTEKAHELLDAWPSSSPEDLVDRLIEIISERQGVTEDATEQRKLSKFMDALRDVGTGATGEILAKLVTGA